MTKQRTNAAKAIVRDILKYSSAAGMLLLGGGLLAGCTSKPPAAPPPQALPVTVVQLEPTDVATSGEWVGTLDGYVNATIQPQATGYLIKQNYREGAEVSKGQVLFEIDPRPFDAALSQAEGQLAQAKAQVGQAQAQLDLAEINVKRDTPLAQARAIAQSQLDNDTQQRAQQAASVKSAEASVAAAQAAVDNAKLNLGFTHVRSLISGVAGQATLQVGNLVNTQSILTSVSQLNPIKVYFSIGDNEYLSLVQRTHAGGGDLLKSASSVPLTLTLSNGDTYPQKGHIAFVDRQVNAQTGAIRIAATFPNPGNVLRPGQFGRVKAETQMHKNALLIPQVAIQELQGLEQAYVAGADGKAHLVTLKLGPQVGTNWLVEDGVAAGDKVITDNLQKLAEGRPVSPHSGLPAAPTAQATTSAGR